MNFSDDQRAHLEMLQAVITRMAENSFLIRGWSVTLISALFALAANDTNRSYALIAYFPCIVFWCLDAYYLGQERLFRSLYNAASASPSQTQVPLYSMNTTLTAKPRDTWSNALFSVTMLLFHLPLVGIVSLVMWFFSKS